MRFSMIRGVVRRLRIPSRKRGWSSAIAIASKATAIAPLSAKLTSGRGRVRHVQSGIK
jgi:hypothetical protein